MKRAPIVLTSTACGVVALVSYHATVPQASALTSSSTSTLNIGGGATKAGAAKHTSRASKATATRSASTASSSATRSAIGGDAQYPYGDLEVEVTMTGTRITNVTVVKHDVTDPRSAMIDQAAEPLLRSQALQAQSAKLDGVSGASYTSVAYEQSLQSAIDKLKA